MRSKIPTLRLIIQTIGDCVENLIKEVLIFFAAIGTSSQISIIDKILLLLISVVFLPYILRLLVRADKVLKILVVKDPIQEKKEKLKNNFSLNVLRNKMIQTTLEKMVYDFGATRASVLQFHNGGENIKGIPFIKFSMTNEWCPVSIVSEMPNYKDVPIGVFSSLSYAVIEKNKLFFPKIEDLKKVDSGAYAIFTSKGVKSVYISGIFDIHNFLVGIVIMEHLEETVLCEDDKYLFEKSVGVISGLVLCKDGQDPASCTLEP